VIEAIAHHRQFGETPIRGVFKMMFVETDRRGLSGQAGFKTA
jgi:hypothetical protein